MRLCRQGWHKFSNEEEILFSRKNIEFAYTTKFFFALLVPKSHTSGGSKGGARDAPPLGPISFIFMQFSGKIWPNNRFLPPPLELAPPPPHPPSGKFWIRHCTRAINRPTFPLHLNIQATGYCGFGRQWNRTTHEATMVVTVKSKCLFDDIHLSYYSMHKDDL